MYQFSDAFLSGNVAIIIPQEHFEEFLSSCINEGIPDSDDPYTAEFAHERFKDGVDVFAFVEYGDYLNLWRNNEESLEHFDDAHGVPVIDWYDALDQGHIAPAQSAPDIMELL